MNGNKQECRGFVGDEKGFTLVEMVMVLVILGIISLMGFSFIESSVKTYIINNTEVKLVDETWVALNKIVREVYPADAATITAPALPLGATTVTGSTLTFTTITSHFPTGFTAAANCPNCADNSTTISYSLNGTQLIRNTAANNSQLVADGVTAFTVKLSKIPRTVVAGQVSQSNFAYDQVALNPADTTLNVGQAVGLTITMIDGLCINSSRHITNYDLIMNATVFPTWTASDGVTPCLPAALNTYELASYYLTIDLTKTDPVSGLSIRLTQSVYPNPNPPYLSNVVN